VALAMTPEEGVLRVPGGKHGARLVAVLGFATATLAIVVSLIPPEGEPRPWLAVMKIVGSSLLVISAGMGLYACGKATSPAYRSGLEKLLDATTYVIANVKTEVFHRSVITGVVATGVQTPLKRACRVPSPGG